jgi:AAA domain (dynein-related subfamily)
MTQSIEGCLGATLPGDRMASLLERLFMTNLQREEADGIRPTPVCIWGTHGLGKTEIAMNFARERGWKLAYCAPAQFEEMGDLHGLPFKIDPDPTVHGDERTVYMPPDWVPKEEGPGLLIMDDINRADDRILRGVMQLLQHFEMFSWSIPKKWQILATANPDTGAYSVTPMDDAMLTRMLHVSLSFDAKAWAAWALNAGVDKRGVDFVLTYPETVTGKRTTPRSLVQFFNQIADISDLKGSIDLVNVLAASTLDIETATAFTAFIEESMAKLPSTQEILGAKDPTDFLNRIKALSKPGEGKRVDLISTIVTRLLLELGRKEADLPETSAANLIALLTSDVLPGDLKFSLHRDLSALNKGDTSGSKIAEIVCNDPGVARIVLKAM